MPVKQDFQSAPAGLAGRIFFAGGSGGGGNGRDGEVFRRLRGYPMVSRGPPALAQQLQVKCPRCDSVNTKFCYYNNYNLSQPRHFCKNCRRYWTNGGILRNVPIGGGCRKAKRSTSFSSKSSSKSSGSGVKDCKQRRTSSSASRLSSGNPSNTSVATSNASTLTLPISGDPPFHDQLVNTVDAPSCSASETLPEAPLAGSFANLRAASTATSTSLVTFSGFGFSDPSPVWLPAGQQKTIEEIGMQEQEHHQPQGCIINNATSDDLRPAASVGGDASGVGILDWASTMDPALFDLTSGVDPVAYWNRSNWEYTEASLYLS